VLSGASCRRLVDWRPAHREYLWEIIRDELEMADWLSAQLPKLVQRTSAKKLA
jgi:hypothetical protein